MPTFEVQQKHTTWYRVQVEAETVEAAIEKVYNCQLTDEEEKTWWERGSAIEPLDVFWTEETGFVDYENGNGLKTKGKN